jgi:hypothetical protein
MSTLEEFKSAIKTRGLARSNRYVVKFYVPGGDTDGNQLAELFCEATSLPGMNIATQPHRMFGENREMPYERMYDTITLDFYVDADMKVKRLFDEWINRIVDPTTRSINYYNTYITDMNIQAIGVGNDYDSKYEVDLYEVFPKSIAPIQMSASSREPMRMQVTFQYKWWEQF